MPRAHRVEVGCKMASRSPDAYIDSRACSSNHDNWPIVRTIHLSTLIEPSFNSVHTCTLHIPRPNHSVLILPINSGIQLWFYTAYISSIFIYQLSIFHIFHISHHKPIYGELVDPHRFQSLGYSNLNLNGV